MDKLNQHLFQKPVLRVATPHGAKRIIVATYNNSEAPLGEKQIVLKDSIADF